MSTFTVGLLWGVWLVFMVVGLFIVWSVGLPLARVLVVAGRQGVQSYRWGRKVRRGDVRECGMLRAVDNDKVYRCVLPLDHEHYTEDVEHASRWRNDGTRMRWGVLGKSVAYGEVRPIAQRLHRR